MTKGLFGIVGIAGASVAGVYGIYQKRNAAGKLAEANKLAADIQQRYETAEAKLMAAHQETQAQFEALAQLKQQIFDDQIAHFLDVMRNSGKFEKVGGKLSKFDVELFIEDLAEIERDVAFTLERSNMVAAGAVAAPGVIHALSSFEMAPEGWIKAKWDAWSGAAEKRQANNLNAVGSAALSASMGLLISALQDASDAEKAITAAKAYEAQVEAEIGRFEVIELGFGGLRENVQELMDALGGLVERYNAIKVDEAEGKAFEAMVQIAVAMQKIMKVKVSQEDGTAAPNIKQVCSVVLADNP